MHRLSASVVAILALLALGCGDDDQKEDSCTPGDPDTCDAGRVCELVDGGEPACFAPVHIAGRVFDTADDGGIGGARVTAVDGNGFAISAVSVSDEAGAYVLAVATVRTSEGTPAGEPVTLRADAAGYLPYPKAPRNPIPIDLAASAEAGGVYRVETPSTDIALVAVDDPIPGSIAGTVDHEDPAGALVVAVQSGVAVSTAISDTSGDFVLFNVPAGSTTVAAYRAGLNVTPESVTVAADPIVDVVLDATEDNLATVSGSVQIVNAPSSPVTSVILVPDATFDETAIRGEAPAGLRAGDVSGAFTIQGVPPGDYAVLAGFENDGLVRDPDSGISGTDIVHITVPDTGGDVTLEDAFKVTEALATVRPGADGLEEVQPVDPLALEWADDSSEDGYELQVFDAFGNLVFEDTEVERVTGSPTVTYSWAGHGLEEGMVYQFRAWSFHDPRNGDARSYISATEDLRGAFLYGATE